MKRRYIDTETRGVSKAVGVILLVAITVILATTAAVLFVQIGEQRTSASGPSVAFEAGYEAESDSQRLTLSHRSGDKIPANELSVIVRKAECDNSANPNGNYATGDLNNDQSEILAGSRLELTAETLCGSTSTKLDLSTVEIDIVWASSRGDGSDTLFRWSASISS